jgi:phage-related protein
MAVTLEEILLQVRSDGEQARRDLQQTGAELNGFDHQSATAELKINGQQARKELEELRGELAQFAKSSADTSVDVNTTKARASIDELKARLAQLGRGDTSPEVDVRIAKAMIDLEALQAQLDHIDGENVTVDINTRKDLTSRIGGIVREVEQLAVAAGDAGSAIGDAGGGGGGGGGLTGGLSQIPEIGPIVQAVLMGIAIVAGGALVASLAAAAGGVIALAIAFGATLGPALALAIGAIKRFKDQSAIAGTAAHGLRTAFHDFANDAQKALGPGLDAVFRGLTAALHSLAPLVRSLREPFKLFGQTVGQAFKTLGQEFAKPIWQQFFKFFIDSARRLTPLLTKGFLEFSRIMANIAKAAMPFLIKGMREFVGWLGEIAKKTSNMKELRGVIGVMVANLKLWLQLAGSLSKVFLGFIKATLPFSEAFVRWLDKGAKALAQWVNSRQGREEIHQFFQRVMPLVKQMIPLLLKWGVVLAQVFEFFAPLLTAVAAGLNKVTDLIIGFLDWLIKADKATSNWGKDFAAVGKWVSAAAASTFGAIRDAFGFITSLPGKTAGVMKGVWGKIKDWSGPIRSGASAVAHAIVSAFNAVASLPGKVAGFFISVLSKIHGITDNIRGAANAVAHAIVSAFNFVASIPGKVAGYFGDLMGKIRSFAGNASSAALGVGKNIVQGLINGISNLVGAALSAAKNLANQIINAVKSALGISSPSKVMQEIGGHMITGLIKGMNFGAVKNFIAHNLGGIAKLGFELAKAGVISLANLPLQGVKDLWNSLVGQGQLSTSEFAHLLEQSNSPKKVFEYLQYLGVGKHAAEVATGYTPPSPHKHKPAHHHLARGIRDFVGGLAFVGEQGMELANVPGGTDVFNHGETTRILDALASGKGGGDTHFHVTTAGTGNPDVRMMLAQADLIERQRGER